jgi:hypothetical protein
METLWNALISAGGAIIVCLINNIIQANSTRKMIEYRIGQLELKVDKHNTLIERTYALEKDMAVLKERMEKGDDGK